VPTGVLSPRLGTSVPVRVGRVGPRMVGDIGTAGFRAGDGCAHRYGVLCAIDRDGIAVDPRLRLVAHVEGLEHGSAVERRRRSRLRHEVQRVVGFGVVGAVVPFEDLPVANGRHLDVHGAVVQVVPVHAADQFVGVAQGGAGTVPFDAVQVRPDDEGAAGAQGHLAQVVPILRHTARYGVGNLVLALGDLV